MNIDSLVNLIQEDYQKDRDIDHISLSRYPDQEAVASIITKLRRIIFPCCKDVSETIQSVIWDLRHHVTQVLEDAAQADAICEAFFRAIPEVRALAQTDLQAAFDGDPAAYSKQEIVLSYPGLFAITVYRLAHVLYQLGVPMIPRMMTEYAHGLTGIDIHPGARIGEYFFIDHGTGVVIGETTVIGKGVKIYQGVTLGGLSTRGGQSLQGKKRHPTIEDNVTIYANASILGGDTVIGAGTVIGANAFVLQSVSPNTTVTTMDQPLKFRARKPEN